MEIGQHLCHGDVRLAQHFPYLLLGLISLLPALIIWTKYTLVWTSIFCWNLRDDVIGELEILLD